MAFTLNLKPEVEAGLLAHARAIGLSIEDYLERVVKEKVAVPNSLHRLTAEEWTREFEEWADSFPEAPLIPDEALSRENLYPDRW